MYIYGCLCSGEGYLSLNFHKNFFEIPQKLQTAKIVNLHCPFMVYQMMSYCTCIMRTVLFITIIPAQNGCCLGVKIIIMSNMNICLMPHGCDIYSMQDLNYVTQESKYFTEDQFNRKFVKHHNLS